MPPGLPFCVQAFQASAEELAGTKPSWAKPEQPGSVVPATTTSVAGAGALTEVGVRPLEGRRLLVTGSRNARAKCMHNTRRGNHQCSHPPMITNSARPTASTHASRPNGTSQSHPMAPHNESRRARLMGGAGAGPRQYASKLCGLLMDAGARPLWVPCIEITPLASPADRYALDSALAPDSLRNYTHVAFTSKNGVQAVLAALGRHHGDAHSAAEALRATGVRLCALGADAHVRCALGSNTLLDGVDCVLTACIGPDKSRPRVACHPMTEDLT